MIEIHVLLVLMIIGAIIAIEIRDLISSVIAVGAVGLGFSLVCLILKAEDVAITQLVVEIIAVIILIRATVRKDLPRSPSGAQILAGAVAVVFIVVLLVVASGAFEQLPPFGEPLMRVSKDYVSQAVEGTGATNVVGAVLLDFRAYDTLGEATVLFTAVIGVVAVTRRIGRKETDTSDKSNG
jgi:multisubunit Na+/H+ antiporter MnhB subunit